MTSEQIAHLTELYKELATINEGIQSDFDNYYSLKLADAENSVIIMGNAEGLINLATAILELAISRKDGKHYHFGTGALDNCDKELEILYKSPENE
ncbi:MAG TPA: hypothetical protein VF941_07610 [Clostridia bacterium]